MLGVYTGQKENKVIFLTADTHFGSQRTLELSKRPYNIVAEMDEILIQNWNNTVNKNDLVYHLGDFREKIVVGQKILKSKYPFLSDDDKESFFSLVNLVGAHSNTDEVEIVYDEDDPTKAYIIPVDNSQSSAKNAIKVKFE